MQIRSRRRSGAALSIIGGTAALLVGGTSPAQEREIQEITVTAQRRAENIQDVPIAVTALTSQVLEQKGVNDVSQITNYIPNVVIDNNAPFAGSTSVLSAYIRGIGQNDFAFNFDPGVGVYVDGVFYARTVGANVDLLDVERIEVLKGPQGTLFGRNTIGGAISIVTRRPADEFTWRGEVTAGDYKRFDVRGAIDVPLVANRLLSNIAFSSKRRDGYQRRIPFPGDVGDIDGFTNFRAAGYSTSDREGGQNEQNVRGKLLWIANDDVEVTFAADYTNVDQPASASTLLRTVTDGPTPAFGQFYNLCIGTPADVLNGVINTSPDPNGPPVFGFNTVNGVCGPRGIAGLDRGTPATALGAVNADGTTANDRAPYSDVFVTGNIDTSYATGNSFSRIENYGISATIDWDLGGGTNLKSITAYRDLEWSVGMDLDGSPLEMLHTSFFMTQHQASQEVQLSGVALNDRLNWLVGAYYFTEGGWLVDHVTFPAGLLQIYGPNLLNTDAYAAFTHLNYRLTDRWGLTLGLRYTREEKEFEGFQHDLNGFNYKIAGCPDPSGPSPVPGLTCQQLLGFPDPNDPLRYFPPGLQKRNFSDTSPRVGFEFHASDDVMLYASYSEGFKSGSWTTRLSNPLDTAPSFDPEEATSYEIGVKSQLWGRRIVLNAALFWTDYEGIQLNFQEGVSPTFRNAGDAELKGGEIEFQGLLTDRFTLTAAAGYVDAKYTRVEPQTGLTTDFDLPKTPDLTFTIGPRYTMPLGNGGRLTLDADYSYTAALFNDTANTPLLRRPATDIVNASITYTAPTGNWDLVLGGTNLTDERFLITGQDQSAGGQIYGTYNPPRQWFVTFRVRQ